jgi:hypothetical protein
MVAVRQRVMDVADSGADVLMLGETGTGKELVARALHAACVGATTLRRRQLPRPARHLFESRCSATRPGPSPARASAASASSSTPATARCSSTSESMPLNLQAKLLRVLQERELERLGGNTAVPIHCRIIGATKDDLLGAAREGRFRADLLYRLNVITIELPPLRERREDIPLLFEHFVAQAASRFRRPAPPVPAPLVRHLMAQDWPGNVRELRNAAERYALGIYEHPRPRRPTTPCPRWSSASSASSSARRCAPAHRPGRREPGHPAQDPLRQDPPPRPRRPHPAMSTDPLILTVAPNGAYKQKTDHPAVPLSAAEIGAEARRCADAGAAMLHLHVRTPEGATCWTRRPTARPPRPCARPWASAWWCRSPPNPAGSTARRPRWPWCASCTRRRSRWRCASCCPPMPRRTRPWPS